MKKYLLAATLICAFAVPVLAMGPFYIAFDKAAKKCVMLKAPPSDTDKFAMMGNYRTEADAKMAMAGMTKCNK